MSTTQRKKKKCSVNPLLTERLKKLEVQFDGIPSRVLSQLRDQVDVEVTKIDIELDTQITKLKEDAKVRLRNKIAEIITLKSVGKAFASITAETPSLASPLASESSAVDVAF